MVFLLQQVSNFREQHFFRRGSGGCSRNLFLFSVKSIECLDQAEDGEGHDEKVEDGIEEAADHHSPAAGELDRQSSQGLVVSGDYPQ